MFKVTVWVFLSVVALSSALAAEQAGVRIRTLLGISAENGVVSLDGNNLAVFSVGDLSLRDGADRDWKLVSATGGAVSIKAEGTRWQEIKTSLPVSEAHAFALCDPLNQVNLSLRDEKMQSALPAGAKVKSIVQIHDHLNVVIFSTSDNSVRYDVRVGVVESSLSGAYSLLDESIASDHGSFCGVQPGNGGVFFVYVDEPSGSSDFSSVYIYTVQGEDQVPR